MEKVKLHTDKLDSKINDIEKYKYESKDHDKIQIESVDSSFIEENVKSKLTKPDSTEYKNDKKQRLLEMRRHTDSREKKANRKKSKKNDSEEASSDSDKSLISSHSNISSISISKRRKYTKSKKFHRNKENQDSDQSENSDSGSVSDSASRSTSSQSSSVSELLSDSDSNSKNSENEKSDNISEDCEKLLKRDKRKTRHKKRRNVSRSSSRQSSSASYDNGESSDDLNHQIESETNSDIERSVDQPKKYLASNKKLLKEKIQLVTHKCNGYSYEVSKTIKQLKILKKKKQMCSSSKEKFRYDLHKKKVFKKKRKLENKLKVYQRRLDRLKHSNKQINSEKNREKTEKYNISHMESYSEEIMHQNNNFSSCNSNMKIPYPVLNDKRDYKVILKILKSKQKHLNGMLAQTLDTMKDIELNKDSSNYEDQKARHNRLKNLEENIKVQLTRLSRQIDFVNFNLEIDRITKTLKQLKENQESDDDECNQNSDKISRCNRKLNDFNKKVEHLFTFMKDANQRLLKQQLDHDETCSSKADIENPRDSNKFEASSLPITYYRNVPPPIVNKSKEAIPQELPDASNKSLKSAKPVYSINPNHNIHNIVNESTNFNKLNHSSIRQAINKNANSKSNSKAISSHDECGYQNSNSKANFGTNKPEISKKITPDSDPKEIAAMLNEKYGYKKSKDEDNGKSGNKPNNSSSNLISSDNNDSQKYSRKPDIKFNNNKNQSSGNQYNNLNARFTPNLLSSNLPTFLLNSPAFMSTMTNMLQNMSQQGVNVNAIMNQLPKIISNFNSNTELANSFSNQDCYSQNRGYYGNKQEESALLPNPIDYGDSMNEDNYTKAFCNYLSNVFQNMGQGINPSMSASQINRMFIESGLIEDFNAYYNSEVNKQSQNNNNKYYNNNKTQISNNNQNTGYNNSNEFFNNGNKYWNNSYPNDYRSNSSGKSFSQYNARNLTKTNNYQNINANFKRRRN